MRKLMGAMSCPFNGLPFLRSLPLTKTREEREREREREREVQLGDPLHGCRVFSPKPYSIRPAVSRY